ncbi:amino acid adenylation domain-containing protein, partial [Rhodococcus sp. H29-C3]|uniref:amino acid adenylation domain-containing protein n=1 Tax=Rhodococcus sp. H29-C3 TaxID=3046307 RepID=UPI0024BA5279
LFDADGGAAGLSATLTYATDLFDESTMVLFAERFVRVLEAVVADSSVVVGDIGVLGVAERDVVVSGWNGTSRVLEGVSGSGGVSLASLFVDRVVEVPGAVAVVFGGERLSYGEFGERVFRLARWLIGEGVGPEVLVGLGMRRGVDLLVGMYAVVVAGGAYVPLDPDLPVERNGFIVEVASPVLVLVSGGGDVGVFAGMGVGVSVVDVGSLDVSGFSGEVVGDGERLSVLRGSNAAYVIFTSGSTGRPKGVAVSHEAIVNRLLWMQDTYQLTGSDVVLQKTPFTFDVSVWEFFWALQVGASVVVAIPDGHRDPNYLARLIADESVTTMHFVPSMLAVFVSELEARGTRLPSLRMIFASGEALPAATAQRVFSALPHISLHNLYGPTEAAVDVTFHEVRPDESVIPIGAPVWNTRVFVLDRRLSPVPVGVEGELYLAGVQLARGYVGRPDLTADRFVAHPVPEARVRGERLYRTGDVVRWNARGELDYVGRSDFQVKLRGLRIELGEIETILLEQNSISQAAVLVRDEQLVAYVVTDAADFDSASVRAALGSKLAEYMVPSVFVELEEFPLGSSGKLDRKALPAPVVVIKEFRAPTTPVEEIVADTFAGVLGLERVGLDDDFFELGGNSLIATQLVSRLGQVLNTKIGVRELFEASSVADLATRIASQVGSGSVRALIAVARPERIPLSLAQQRYWFLNQYDTTSAVDNIPFAVRLSGELNVAALEAAMMDLIARHESLRTIYPDSLDGPRQEILHVEEADADLAVVDVQEVDIRRRVIDLMMTAFDVTTEIPRAAKLFKLADDDYVLAFVIHHVSADGASMAPLVRDVMVAYAARSAGEAPGWAPLPVQYADYALWQRETLGSEKDPDSIASQQVSYWKAALAGLPDQLDMPSDRPRPAHQSFRGDSVRFTVDAELHRALLELSRRHHTTLFMTMHAAFAVLLARLSNVSDIAVGTPVAGRGDKALDDMIGMFVNTLVFRSRVDSSMTFEELLAQTRETDLQAFAHADVPFERLVEVLNPVRSTARNPLFQVGLSFQNMTRASLELPGLTLAPVDVNSPLAKTDLQLTIFDGTTADGRPAEINAEFTFATDLFDRSTVDGFAERLVSVLRAVVGDSSVVVGDVELVG